MNDGAKRQHVSQWAKISLDIKSDAKWYVIKRVIKQETGRDFRATDICNLFMQYCFASKKARRPVDVRTLVFDRELLLHDETVTNIEDIDLLNKYFVRIELLTKRFTIANYYKWNDGDELQTSASGANINRKYANSFANQNDNIANELQTELQTSCKPTSRTHPAEYTQRYRLLKKQKSQALTPNEAAELESLHNFFANANNENSANTANDLQTDASKMQTCKQTANTPLEEEKETEEEIRIDDIKKINKKDFDASRFQKPSIEEITEYCTQRQNTVDAESFYHHYESVGWKVGNKPMKSWQSCVITWEKRNNSQVQNSNQSTNFSKGYDNTSVQRGLSKSEIPNTTNTSRSSNGSIGNRTKFSYSSEAIQAADLEAYKQRVTNTNAV